jgi:hypothetical protein
MKKTTKFVSSLCVLIITFTVCAIGVSAANTTITFSMPTLNAVFSSSSNTAYSNVAHTSKGSTYSDYNVYCIEVTGTITSSESGIQNYLYVYNETYDVYDYILLPNNGSLNNCCINADIPLEGDWYFQLVSVRSSTGTLAAATLTNGRVKFYCTY